MDSTLIGNPEAISPAAFADDLHEVLPANDLRATTAVTGDPAIAVTDAVLNIHVVEE